MTVVSFETSGLNTPIQSQCRDFPRSISYALARIAGRVGRFNGLSLEARALLAEIVRCACVQRPLDPIRLSNAHLASCLGISPRSICRLKSVLEDGGWITRHQKQSRKHGMQILDMQLTFMCAEALGLVTKKTVNNKQINLTHQIQSLTLFGLKEASLVILMSKAKKKRVELHEFVMKIAERVAAAKNPYAYILKSLENFKGHDSKNEKHAKSSLKADPKPEKIFLDKDVTYTANDDPTTQFIFCSITECLYRIQSGVRHVFLNHAHVNRMLMSDSLSAQL